MAYRREDYVRGTLLPQARFDCSITVCLFSNETKDDGINPKQIEIIKFRKKFLKEYVLAFICAKS